MDDHRAGFLLLARFGWALTNASAERSQYQSVPSLFRAGLCCPALRSRSRERLWQSKEFPAIRRSLLHRYQIGAHPAQRDFKLIDPAQTGVDFTIDWQPRDGESIQGINSTGSCGGVSIGDFDGDGRPDLFLTRPFGGNRLYRNLGNFRFEDVTERAGLKRELDYDAWGSGSCFVDINNDGHLDLYVCSHGRPNRLYINRGDGTFVEKAHEYGLDFSGASVTMAFADFDRDGDLDAYLVTNWLVPNSDADSNNLDTYWEFRDGRLRMSKEFEERFDVLKLPSGKIKAVQGAQLDHFYRNDGGKFVEATREVLGDYSAAENFNGLAARWFDYDDDGYPDLYVSNDYYGPDQLFHNNGDGTMTDVAKTALPHTPWYSMGSDAADVNNDGRLDFMASDMAFTDHEQYHMGRGRVPDETWFVDMSNPRQQVTNTLFINTGTPRFIEASALAGISNTDWTWAVKFADFDNDGRIDLYTTNGAPRNWTDSDAPKQLRAKHAGPKFVDQWEAYWKDQPLLREKNFAFRNLGDLKFENVSAEWGLDFEGVSFGSAVGDLDGDGDLDIVTVNFEDPVHIYRNEGGKDHRVVIQLQGTKSNRQGIGAVVQIETDAGLQVRDLPSVRGFMSADDPKVYFGLGQADTIKRMTIRWPSGIVQRFKNLPADDLYTVTESAASDTDESPAAAEEPMFVERLDLPKVVHVEQPFDDFAAQPLLPRRLSKLGPGIACADINGDGRDDYYQSGAKGSLGQLLLANDTGFTIDSTSDPTFEINRASEEMAPLFFDADGDGRQDLYVVNGSIEDEPNSENYQDCLYLNVGDGKFEPAPKDSLPDMRMSGSVAAAADFDHDGDLDLFVGGRTVPGSYPQTPRSALLRNEGGRFVDVTDELAPGLRKAGMVTSAIWSDVDGDGWPDLLVTTEWGPVELWHNDHGHLSNATQAAGLAELTGWWNGIAAGDLNHDGNIDYVVTNFGLNTRYHATKQHPASMFYGDMDEDGIPDIVEGEFIGDKLYPLRDKSSLTDAMTWWLDGASSTFRQFAKSTLVELFGKDKLQAAKTV